jgi:hypothetical protein
MTITADAWLACGRGAAGTIAAELLAAQAMLQNLAAAATT